MLLGEASLEEMKLPKNTSLFPPFSIALHHSRISMRASSSSPITHHPYFSSSTSSSHLLIFSSSHLLFSTYRNWGDPDDEAIDARADSPGNCGSEALWCKDELCVDVDEGLEMGSMGGKDCLPSSVPLVLRGAVFVAVENDGRSRTCSRLAGRRWSMAAGRYTGARVDAVVAVWGEDLGERSWL
jgi:hypothetical protein